MKTDYEMLGRQFAALAEADDDPLALAANFVALLYSELERVNWLGFYIRRGEDLVLGPFQGLPACIRIPLGQGVCGTAARDGKTLRVDDVHAFEGHIACDPASRSELVVPLESAKKVVAVLDIDSPEKSRFSADDQSGIEALCRTFTSLLEARGRPLVEFI
jgi:GAF domain-containing protein